MHVDPIKPTLKAPGTKRLTLTCNEPLSNFAFNFNVSRYSEAPSEGLTENLQELGFEAGAYTRPPLGPT
jgi:hypothetical protein